METIKRHRGAIAAMTLWLAASGTGVARAQEIPVQIADPPGVVYPSERCPADGKPHRIALGPSPKKRIAGGFNPKAVRVKFPSIGDGETGKGALVLDGTQDWMGPKGTPRGYASLRLRFHRQDSSQVLTPSETGRLARLLERSLRIAADFQRTPESTSPFPRRVRVAAFQFRAGDDDKLSVQVEQQASQAPEIVFLHTSKVSVEEVPRNFKPRPGRTVSFRLKSVDRSVSVRTDRLTDVAQLARDAQRLSAWLAKRAAP